MSRACFLRSFASGRGQRPGDHSAGVRSDGSRPYEGKPSRKDLSPRGLVDPPAPRNGSNGTAIGTWTPYPLKGGGGLTFGWGTKPKPMRYGLGINELGRFLSMIGIRIAMLHGKEEAKCNVAFIN